MADTVKRIQFTSPDIRRETTLQMAPLVDIVFLLICFYLLVTQLITHQSDPAVKLPTMTSAMAGRPNPAEVVVNLRATGELVMDGRVVTLDQVRSLLADSMVAARATDQPVRVVIRADREQRYAALDELFTICRELTIRDVILRAQEGER